MCFEARPDHIFWHQVQGEIYFTPKNFCYFVVWTTKDAVVLKISKDEAWSENVTKLAQFYFENLSPKIVEGQL